MSDVKVEQKKTLSRQDAARLVQALADGLCDDGRVTVRLGTSTLELSVAGQVDCEIEASVDGDQRELELELKWSISGRPSADGAEESEVRQIGEDEPEDESEGDAVGAGDGEGATPERDAADEEGAADGSPVDEAAGSSESDSVSAVAPDQIARPRRGPHKPAEAGKSAFNGVDTASVRAWAAANGIAVSPRGRIKDEVFEAYRAAGN